MLKDIGKNNLNEISNNKKKSPILLVTDNIQHYQQQFNNYNINNYKILFVKWNDILTFITNLDDTKRKNLELVILEIDTAVEEYEKENQISIAQTNNIIEEIKKMFSDKKIFFILPSESMINRLLSTGICKQEDIKIQPFSVFDIIDLISITKKKERLYQLQLKEHSMSTYSSTDEKIEDAIKFLKIGIKNNEATLLLLSKDIEYSYIQSKMALHSLDISKLKNDGLKIATSEEFYLSFQTDNNNKHNIVAIDEKIKRKFYHLVDQFMKKNGKKGLRVFAMMDCFFEHSLIDELVEYECVVPPIFRKPILGVCVYDEKHISQLSEDQIRRLMLTHSNVWI